MECIFMNEVYYIGTQETPTRIGLVPPGLKPSQWIGAPLSNQWCMGPMVQKCTHWVPPGHRLRVVTDLQNDVLPHKEEKTYHTNKIS